MLALLTGAAFALRAFVESDPGPLFIGPVLLAAYWWGRTGGTIAGVVETLVFVAAWLVNKPMASGSSVLLAGGLRGVVYVGTGYAFGWLIDDRVRLSAEVAESSRVVEELRALQEALAPMELPDRPALELASVYVPAESGVAGDFFLIEPGPHDKTVVVVGDVAGKGIQAAKRAAYVRVAMVAAAPFEDDPCKLLSMANAALIERAGVSETFVTACCVVIDPAAGSLRFALAGHPPLLRLDDGRVVTGVQPAYPLGIGAEIDCECAEMDFAPGTGFVAFTDGLIEARQSGGDLFGTERATAVLARLSGRAPRAVVGELRAAAESFSGGRLADDLCVVAVRAS